MADVNGWFERAMNETRRSSRILLVALVLDVFFIPPLVDVGALPAWFAAVATTVTLLAATFALGGHRAARGFLFAAAALALVSRWVHVVAGADGTALLNSSVMAVATGAFAGVLLVDVFSRGRLPDRLLAVLLAYVFIGATWAEVYHVAQILHPGALSLPGRAHPISEYIYFSFATLTSVGYGDVLPVHPLVRSLAVLEALTGQLYLVLVISRFVGEAAARASAGER